VKRTFAAGLFVAASTAAFAQQTPAGTQTSHPTQPAGAHSPTGEQQVTGCLTSADNIFTLTLLDADQPPGSTAPTVSYTLAPGTGVELQQHVNKKITVTGTEAGPGMENSARVVVDNSQPAPAPTGTSGTANPAASDRPARDGDTPTVQTSAKAKIVAKTLNVSKVESAEGDCTEAK
jgi:hypothetical protein